MTIMKRYYLSAIVGDGSEENPYRVAMADEGVAYSASIPTDPQGRPINTVALCVVDANNHARLMAKPEHDVLPDFVMDGKVSAMHTVTKNGMIARMRARGLATDFIANADGYREVIRGIGRQLGEASFDENKFDVG